MWPALELHKVCRPYSVLQKKKRKHIIIFAMKEKKTVTCLLRELSEIFML